MKTPWNNDEQLLERAPDAPANAGGLIGRRRPAVARRFRAVCPCRGKLKNKELNLAQTVAVCGRAKAALLRTGGLVQVLMLFDILLLAFYLFVIVHAGTLLL